ncbi:cupin domain-containing protein [Leifsonia sp. 2MCAF36]|uniref:cupin domain-containing protein n=1 Tax=Leifsonia sp. 2MCAF36 TaxID=3232988 RepID=UPI003F96A01A
MADQTEFSAGSYDESALEPFEVGRVQWVRRFGEGGRVTSAAGFWVVSPEDAPEPFTVVGEADESIFIFQGRLSLEIDGNPALELGPGAGATLNEGVSTRWTIHEPVVEFFVYS